MTNVRRNSELETQRPAPGLENPELEARPPAPFEARPLVQTMVLHVSDATHLPAEVLAPKRPKVPKTPKTS